LAPAYRIITTEVIPTIKTVPRSGIKTKTPSKTTFAIAKLLYMVASTHCLAFLISHELIKITYISLKNSEGWILGSQGISSHHLAPLSSTQMTGANTRS
jgi:hypothetical protein